MTEKTYIFHHDPGHGWLAVKRSELAQLGILNKISSCSYQRGKTVYLEEDCDATLFFQAKNATPRTLNIRESFQENTPIRNYQPFNN